MSDEKLQVREDFFSLLVEGSTAIYRADYAVKLVQNNNILRGIRRVVTDHS